MNFYYDEDYVASIENIEDMKTIRNSKNKIVKAKQKFYRVLTNINVFQ